MEHASLEQDYESAKIFYGLKKWKLAHLNHEKEIYSNYSNSNNEYYIAAVEQIKVLKTAKKKLPLLFGKLKTEEGLSMLQSQLKET